MQKNQNQTNENNHSLSSYVQGAKNSSQSSFTVKKLKAKSKNLASYGNFW